jgi:hypothetical protein
MYLSHTCIQLKGKTLTRNCTGIYTFRPALEDETRAKAEKAAPAPAPVPAQARTEREAEDGEVKKTGAVGSR